MSDNLPIRNTGFRNVIFQHSDWHQPEGFGVYYDPTRQRHQWRIRDSFKRFRHQANCPDAREWANTPQAALHVPGAVHMECAHHCFIDGCTIRNVGWHAVSMYEACQGNVITACHLHDLGAGGIVADGGDHLAPIQYRTGKNTVTDNLIENTGHIWPSACGITFANSFANQIIHNELTDLTYTGISVGWVWGFGENVSRDNRVEYNNIHHLAIRAGLSDLGGIYTLGIQPGTVIRGNHIHDIENSAYGGQGIYLDEGSSFMLVEQNLVHHCASHAFCEHFGKNNLVRDNLFLLCGDKKDSTGQPAGSVAMICRVLTRNASIPWPPRTTSLYRNVFLT